MIKMKALRLVIAFGLLASCSAADDDGGDEHQCHDLYEYIATKKGQVTSPFYGKREEYHNGLWCEYRIRSPRGTRIKVTFKVLDIQPSSGCAQDKLVVYGKSKQTVLGIFCGYELPQPILSGEGENEVRLLFHTDFMAGGKGFVLEYESGRNLSLCQPGYTLCGNRNCYENSKKCDGNDDCGDGTDEEDCGFPIVTSPSECGNTPIVPKTYESTDRMVGGESVIPHSWPWQASLQTALSEPNGHFCGGTLLNAQWVLSAGHCVAGFSNPNQVKIHLGQHSKFKKSKYEQIRRGIKIISYPDLEFDNLRRFSFTDDVTLIKLNAPVKFNDGVQPGCLPSLGYKPPPKTKCYVTGWGETRGTGGSDVLKQSEQIVQSQEQCTHNEQTQICLYNYNNNPCHGDSGGPLSCKLGGKWYVFGAASFVTTTNFMSGLCTGEGSRTVYASSADKIEWINTIINKYS